MARWKRTKIRKNETVKRKRTRNEKEKGLMNTMWEKGDKKRKYRGKNEKWEKKKTMNGKKRKKMKWKQEKG